MSFGRYFNIISTSIGLQKATSHQLFTDKIDKNWQHTDTCYYLNKSIKPTNKQFCYL